jgi:UDP-N-acetyl-D-mannosaminuronate dehydrogenase
MRAREVQAERMAETCLKYGKNITIVGKAYKPGVHYTNGSASMLVGHYIEGKMGNVNYYDEHTGDNDLKTDWTEVYLIGYWDDYVSKIDFPKTATIIDPWRKFQKSDNVIHYGNTRKV